MGTIGHYTMSLDGYVAGPRDAMDWTLGHGGATSLADETMRRIGAVLGGRRWYDLAVERWNGVDGIYGGAFDGPVFVLSHRPSPPDADLRVSFLPGPVEAAVATAQAAAGDRDVAVFGASLIQQCLRAGILDELVLHVVPVLLGGGVALFDGDGRVELERVSIGQGDQITDLRFRVLIEPPA